MVGVLVSGAEPGGGGYIAQRIFSAKDEKNGLLFGMSSQSTQTSRPAATRTSCSSWTNAPSCREYETKTSATRQTSGLASASASAASLSLAHHLADVGVDVLLEQRLDRGRERREARRVRAKAAYGPASS